VRLERRFERRLRECRGFEVVGAGRKGTVDGIRVGSGSTVAGLIVRFGRDLVLIRKKDVKRIDPGRYLVYVAEHLSRQPAGLG
jgi:hypothetical protein